MRRSTASSQARSRARASSGPRSPPIGAAAGVALGHHALDHPQHRAPGRARASPSPRPSARIASAIAACAHLAAEPCSPCALDAAGAHVGEELLRRGGARRLGPGAADVDARRGRRSRRRRCRRASRRRSRPGWLSSRRARAVADLPDGEQLREPAPVARRQRRLDGVERVRERAGDLAARAGSSATTSTSPACACSHSWSSGRDARGRGRAPACGSPRKPAVSSSETKTSGRSAISSTPSIVSWSVIVTKSMPAALGERVDLLRRRGALGQAERALDAELRDLRRGRVAVQVRAARAVMSLENSPAICRRFRDQSRQQDVIVL